MRTTTMRRFPGSNQGELKPGCHCCWPGWHRVSHLVSKQLVTYNHRPKSCPTSDFVFVDIDLSVALRIGPSFDRVQDFVFHMGAERLDAYLSFQVEESIRGLVYDVTHDRVNDLRSEFAADMLSVLQAKVERFGIEIVNVKVTDVALPRELQARLESTTAFKTRLTEEAKNHELEGRVGEESINECRDNVQSLLRRIRGDACDRRDT
jgi:regulator of protease activity HflC (stomatin/prohibitin superfamily)